MVLLGAAGLDCTGMGDRLGRPEGVVSHSALRCSIVLNVCPRRHVAGFLVYGDCMAEHPHSSHHVRCISELTPAQQCCSPE